MRRNVSDEGELIKETKSLVHLMGMSQIMMCKKHSFSRYLKNILLFNFVNIPNPQKLSAKSICFWELGSRVPPQFPALVVVVGGGGSVIIFGLVAQGLR